MQFFKESEFECKCGCGTGYPFMGVKFLAMLDEARLLAEIPFSLSSAARCLEHNRSVGSKDTSSHIKGLAVDIKCTSSRERFVMFGSLIAVGFTRIGIGRDFIHVDYDLDKPGKVAWMY